MWYARWGKARHYGLQAQSVSKAVSGAILCGKAFGYAKGDERKFKFPDHRSRRLVTTRAKLITNERAQTRSDRKACSSDSFQGVRDSQKVSGGRT